MTLSAARSYRSPRLLERQETILAAARDELAEKGYDGVTMDGLARRAGVARRTLYNNYGTKDELVITAISELITSYHDLGPDAAPGFSSIIASREKAIELVLASPAYADAMTIAIYQAPAEHKLITLLLHNAIEFALEHLRVERDRGNLKPEVPLTELADQLTSQAWGQILLNQKQVTSLENYRKNSLLGLLLLLESASQGKAQERITAEREALLAEPTEPSGEAT